VNRSGPSPASPEQNLASFTWRVRHSAWMLPVLLGFGFMTWVGFAYIAARARKPIWTAVAVGYLAAAVTSVTVSSMEGADSSSVVGGVIGTVTWVVGIVHAFLVRPSWLRWRAHHDQWPPVTAASDADQPPLPITVRPLSELIRVNTAGPDELGLLPWFDADRTVRVIVERERRGRFFTIEEFAAAAQLDGRQLQVIRALVTV
jgi:hypothetical protein